MRMLRRLIGILVLGVVMLVMVQVQVVGADSIANHVVISEVQIATSEFVELYNPTNNDIVMTGWHWCYFSDGRNWDYPYRDKVFPSEATISAHGFYLIATTSGEFPTADWNLEYAVHFLSDTAGSVGIFPWDPDTKTAGDAESGRIDAVAWGTVSHVKEGTEADVPTPGKSLQRRVNDTITENGYGPGWDSNDNSADFFIQDSPDPQNSGADPLPPVPELSTLILLSIGLIALAGYVLLTKRRD